LGPGRGHEAELRLVMYKSNSSYIEEMLAAPGMDDSASEDLDQAIGKLPTAFWAAGGIMCDNERREKSMSVANLRISAVGNRTEALIFDPLLAREIGWRTSTVDPFTFVDSDGKPMATTRFWRDGWQQERKHAQAFRWAEGQRVELTESGQAEAERIGGLPGTVIARWRCFKPSSSKPEVRSQWRSDADDAITVSPLG
jgi:hypothetical protein